MMVWSSILIFALLQWHLLLVESQYYDPILNVDARKKVVKAGEPFDFVCRVGRPIERCFIKFSNSERYIRVRDNYKRPDHEYLGNGFQRGDCGFRYYAVEPEQHGSVFCIVTYSDIDDESIGLTDLVVAVPPTNIELITSKEEYIEGEEIRIICLATGGHPAPSVSLFLDNVTLKESSTLQEKVIFSKNATIKDNGKELVCLITHAAMDEPKFLKRKLVVLFKPRPSVQKFSLREGKEGVITVEVLANPEPSLEWKINGENPHMYNYSVSSLIRQNEETGFWLAELRIPNVTNRDADKEVELTATNKYGSQIYIIKIVLEPHGNLGPHAIIIPDGLGPADLVAGVVVIGLALVTYICFTIALLLLIIIPSATLLRDAE